MQCFWLSAYFQHKLYVYFDRRFICRLKLSWILKQFCWIEKLTVEKKKNQIAGVNDENKLGLLTRESQLKFRITKISMNNENNQRTLGFTVESIKLNIDQNKHFSGYISRAIIRIWHVWKIRPYQDKLGYLGSCAIVASLVDFYHLVSKCCRKILPSFEIFILLAPSSKQEISNK